MERRLSPPAHPQAWRRPFLQDLATKPEQRGGAASSSCRHQSGRFDQCTGFHQAAKILLVEMPARDRLDGQLQFSECEFRRQ